MYQCINVSMYQCINVSMYPFLTTVLPLYYTLPFSSNSLPLSVLRLYSYLCFHTRTNKPYIQPTCGSTPLTQDLVLGVLVVPAVLSLLFLSSLYCRDLLPGKRVHSRSDRNKLLLSKF